MMNDSLSESSRSILHEEVLPSKENKRVDQRQSYSYGVIFALWPTSKINSSFLWTSGLSYDTPWLITLRKNYTSQVLLGIWMIVPARSETKFVCLRKAFEITTSMYCTTQTPPSPPKRCIGKWSKCPKISSKCDSVPYSHHSMRLKLPSLEVSGVVTILEMAVPSTLQLVSSRKRFKT